LSVTGGSERGSEISGARLYQRQGAERRSGGVEGCGIRDELNGLDVICTTPGQSLQSGHAAFPPIRLAIPTRVAAPFDHPDSEILAEFMWRTPSIQRSTAVPRLRMRSIRRRKGDMICLRRFGSVGKQSPIVAANSC
jgi:hypothetical protein